MNLADRWVQFGGDLELLQCHFHLPFLQGKVSKLIMWFRQRPIESDGSLKQRYRTCFSGGIPGSRVLKQRCPVLLIEMRVAWELSNAALKRRECLDGVTRRKLGNGKVQDRFW